MSDIFVSYARSTEPQAKRVAEALRGLGYNVWRDDELPAHRSFSEVIEERLKAARAVVVIWSAEAAKSEWVQSGADRARTDRKLVQISVDGAPLPMPFDRIQCADLSGWSGDIESAGWKKVADSIADLVRGGAQAAAAPEPTRPRSAHRASICVLPFANMSDDPQQEYFSDGISEDIITDLSKVSALGVIARNTAFTFKGRSVKVPDVARELDVSHVLEGSVRKAGGRVRITAQLIDGAAPPFPASARSPPRWTGATTCCPSATRRSSDASASSQAASPWERRPRSAPASARTPSKSPRPWPAWWPSRSRSRRQPLAPDAIACSRPRAPMRWKSWSQPGRRKRRCGRTRVTSASSPPRAWRTSP